jgi:very-short-patch-repair endonuclease
MSDAEEMFVHYARVFGLPAYEREYRFNAPETQHRFDFAFPTVRVAVEVDGGQWVARGGRHARDVDRWKQNLAAKRGWRVMHFSPEMLKDDPEGCIQMVKSALEWKPDQGWIDMMRKGDGDEV